MRKHEGLNRRVVRMEAEYRQLFPFAKKDMFFTLPSWIREKVVHNSPWPFQNLSLSELEEVRQIAHEMSTEK
jgi:hypothetical protein